MLRRLSTLLCLLPLFSGFGLAQNIAEDTAQRSAAGKTRASAAGWPVYIRCGALFGGKSDQLEPNVVIASVA